MLIAVFRYAAAAISLFATPPIASYAFFVATPLPLLPRRRRADFAATTIDDFSTPLR